MAISQVSDLNSLYNTIFEDSLVVLRETNMMVGSGMVTQYNGTGFMDRKVPIYNKANVRTKAEGADFAGTTTYGKTNKATFTPAVKMAQFIMTDEQIATDPENIVTRARTELGEALAEDIDVTMMSNFSSLNASKGTAGSALTFSTIAAGISRLQGQKVRGTRYCLLHPYQWHDVWVELGKPAAEQAFLGDTANEALRDYFVGSFIGAMWVTSANVSVDSSDDASGAVFTSEAVAYDQREAFQIEPERDASRRATELNASVAFGHGILRQEAGVKILSDATEPTG